jgi:hypothetical protein
MTDKGREHVFKGDWTLGAAFALFMPFSVYLLIEINSMASLKGALIICIPIFLFGVAGLIFALNSRHPLIITDSYIEYELLNKHIGVKKVYMKDIEDVSYSDRYYGGSTRVFRIGITLKEGDLKNKINRSELGKKIIGGDFSIVLNRIKWGSVGDEGIVELIRAAVTKHREPTR